LSTILADNETIVVSRFVLMLGFSVDQDPRYSDKVCPDERSNPSMSAEYKISPTERLCAKVNPSGTFDATSVSAPIDLTGVNENGVNPNGVNPNGVNPKGVNPKGVNPNGVNPKGVNPNGGT
jgi:hypothetical protein